MSAFPRLPLRTLMLVAACVVAALGGAWVAATYWTRPATEVAAVYDHPRPIPDFALVAHDGSRFDRARLKGHYTFVFFGYTNCPALCPATLTELAAAMKEMPPARRPAVVLVSVDPARDTPEVLARYVPHFDPRFVGATGTDEALGVLTGALGAAYLRDPPVDGSYAVEHTSALFLINPDAEVAAVFPAPHVAHTLAADYLRIRGRG
ncbi:MAG TPA: SCO family protein [Steroidobacteraceae bacterium]|nr:SCO family protein [Steroidobacteraceae bacterium]